MDKNLKETNKNYAVARSKALKNVVVRTVPEACFHDWNTQRKKKGGQVKMERVMNREQFAEWENFVEQWLNDKKMGQTVGSTNRNFGG